MKDITTATSSYETPEARVIEVNIQSLVCTSPTGQTETYSEGDTSGWYND